MKKQTKALISWAFYDFGNSAFAATIQTFVFAAYFTEAVAPNPVTGSALWGVTNGVAALLIAFLAPIMGAWADQSGQKKKWIAAFTALCVVSTACLWFVTPQFSYLPIALILIVLSTVGSEVAFVFYNAMLPNLAPKNLIGRWSGWGWAFGYAGGMSCLIIALLFLMYPDTALFSFNHEKAEHVRATFLLTALWYALFSLPLFFFTKTAKGSGLKPEKILVGAFSQLTRSIINVKAHLNIALFLLAHMFYIDGLTTLFAFGGIWAVSLYQFNQEQILLFGIVMHVFSGVGAFVFAWIDDKIGSRRLILLSIFALILFSSFLLVGKTPKTFWIFGSLLGVFVGPLQSSSRSFLAKAAPKHLQNEFFGFLALSGKATAFLGPLISGWLIWYTQSVLTGMAVVLTMFLLGGFLMLFVTEDECLKSDHQAIE